MRAVRLTASGVAVVDVPDPRAGKDRVVVRVGAAGICGSDLAMADAGPSSLTPGHEIAGFLEDGTAVAVEPIDACGECDQCRSHRRARCRRGNDVFIGGGADGGMAEWITVPASAVVPLEGGVDPSNACLVEPLAVALHGLELGGVPGRERVAVVGGGTIGLCVVASAAAEGCDVGLVARHLHQRQAGEELGAGSTLGLYDVVVEAAGTASGLRAAIDLCEPGATLVVLGIFWDQMPLPGLTVLDKELTVVVSKAYGGQPGGRDVDAAAALLARRPMIASTLITHRFPLEDAATAFATARDRLSGSIKVVLEPG